MSVPTNYDSDKNFFDTSFVENVLDTVLLYNQDATIVIKSTIPVGYTKRIKRKIQGQHYIQP